MEQMLQDIQDEGEAALKAAGLAVTPKIRRALYAQYRVLSQLTHTSVLGMTATMQRSEDGSVSVGDSLPKPILALILHTATASVVNVSGYTASAFFDGPENVRLFLEWTRKGHDLASRMAEQAGPQHGLTTF